MQQLWNELENDVLAPVCAPLNLPTVDTQWLLPSFSEPLVQQLEPSSESFPDLSMQQDTSSHSDQRSRTRIYDFNMRPYIRVPNAIPYPDHLELDLSADYRGVLDGTKVLSPEAKARAERNLNYVMEKQKAEGKAPSDRGLSLIYPEDGLEGLEGSSGKTRSFRLEEPMRKQYAQAYLIWKSLVTC